MPGPLEAPAFLCPLILSFRESNVPEAQFPRRTLLGFSVNRVRLPPCVLLFLYAVEAARPAVSCARPQLGQLPE